MCLPAPVWVCVVFVLLRGCCDGSVRSNLFLDPCTGPGFISIGTPLWTAYLLNLTSAVLFRSHPRVGGGHRRKQSHYRH